MENKNQTLLNQTIMLIQLSSMEENEKAMWNILLPNMSEEEVTKFHQILLNEINALNDLYNQTPKL